MDKRVLIQHFFPSKPPNGIGSNTAEGYMAEQHASSASKIVPGPIGENRKLSSVGSYLGTRMCSVGAGRETVGTGGRCRPSGEIDVLIACSCRRPRSLRAE